MRSEHYVNSIDANYEDIEHTYSKKLVQLCFILSCIADSLGYYHLVSDIYTYTPVSSGRN